MTTVSIPLAEGQVAALRLRAEQAGISLEEYLARCVGATVSRPRMTFEGRDLYHEGSLKRDIFVGWVRTRTRGAPHDEGSSPDRPE